MNLATIHRPKWYIFIITICVTKAAEPPWTPHSEVSVIFHPPPCSQQTSGLQVCQLWNRPHRAVHEQRPQFSTKVLLLSEFDLEHGCLYHFTLIDTYSIIPCDLLMVMAKAGLTGNCLLCQWKGYSPTLGMKLILGIRTSLPVSATVHLRTLLSSALS